MAKLVDLVGECKECRRPAVSRLLDIQADPLGDYCGQHGWQALLAEHRREIEEHAK